jgi:signal peptidase I
MTSSTGSWNSTPEESTDEEVSPRKPLLALLLSICPGLGQQYAGHLLRGIVFYISLVVVSWLAAIAYMYVKQPFVGLLLLSVPFVGVALIALDAVFCAKRQPDNYRLMWFNRVWIYCGVFLALIVTVNPLMDKLVGERIVRALYVTSNSMQPTVIHRDLVVINKLAKPARGDIVLINFSDDRSEEDNQKRTSKSVSKLIKHQVLRRVIAVAGDTVEIKGRQVFLNGKPLEERYASYMEQESHDPLMSPDYHLEAVFVPAGSYFVLADARQYRLDSRILGLIHKDEISGVATKVFWSWNLDQGHFQWNRTAMSLKQ